MLSKLYRKYPVVKDSEDSRDLVATVLAPVKEDPSEIVDLRLWCGPIKDQGQLGSCTAHAATSMREFLYRKYNDQEVDKAVPVHDFILSPLYLYYKEREFENDINQDGGAQVRTSAKMLNNVGSCLLKDDIYNVNAFRKAPTPEQIKLALVYKSGSYHRINGGIAEMKSVLRSGYTFVFGMTIYQSFEDNFTSRTGIMLIPNISREKCLGGHALHCVGFDNTKQRFIIQNSWGTEWGDKGFFYLPYQIMQDPNFVSDCWVTHLGKAWGTPEEIKEIIKESTEEVYVARPKKAKVETVVLEENHEG